MYRLSRATKSGEAVSEVPTDLSNSAATITQYSIEGLFNKSSFSIPSRMEVFAPSKFNHQKQITFASSEKMLSTNFTKLFGIKHPVVLAGMGQVAGPELVSAVSNAGGLGVVGGALYAPQQLRDILNEVKVGR